MATSPLDIPRPHSCDPWFRTSIGVRSDNFLLAPEGAVNMVAYQDIAAFRAEPLTYTEKSLG